ncbi:MAG: hypothetical protein P8N76_16830 [Pirellulaceae bacterium]|nr:hypothetical protein [Pirellulaceae bacterium]
MKTHSLLDNGRCLAACFALMLLSATWVTVADAQSPGSRLQPKNQLTVGLLGNTAVQEELSLTDAQIAATVVPAKKINGEILSLAFNPELVKHPEKMKVMVDKIKEKEKVLLTHLSSQQQQRLSQLFYQRAGPMFFQDLEVQKALKLTEGQQQQIGKVSDAWKMKMQAQINDMLRQRAEQRRKGLAPQAVREANRKKSDRLLEATNEAFSQILTEKQRDQVAEMKGRPFAFPQ